MTSAVLRNSRIPGFYRLGRAERLAKLVQHGFLNDEQAASLARPGGSLPFEIADKMIENVVGSFELPLGVGLNFVINGRDYAVPMVVEEPSIVAAVSHVASIVREAGGFDAEADRSVMTGQIQVVGLDDPAEAGRRVMAVRHRLLERIDMIEPGMRRRGGGAVDIDVHTLGSDSTSRFGRMLVVHVYVDVCDAMGANLINTVCEGLAPEIELITGGTVYLRILSNLTDRRRVRARCRIPAPLLAWHGYDGAAVVDGIVRASEFAEADPHRAATHNKGIMNGIDAVALATGQDWRAIEAGAHSWAARGERYAPLAVWRRDDEGALVGEIDVPMAVGIVGGPIRLHPTVRTALDMLAITSAGELGCIMGSVGLAQNLAAIKALATTGIQKGHMALHARSVAATAGATGELVERVAAVMIARNSIKVDEALRVLAEFDAPPAAP
jgi:hydroxymethylglutaryl-CoA reductase